MALYECVGGDSGGIDFLHPDFADWERYTNAAGTITFPTTQKPRYGIITYSRYSRSNLEELRRYSDICIYDFVNNKMDEYYNFTWTRNNAITNISYNSNNNVIFSSGTGETNLIFNAVFWY